MSTPAPPRRLRRLTVVAIIASALALFGAASPAAAADPDDSRNGTSSLTVEKQRPTADFTAYRVQNATTAGAPDLTTNAGWDEVNALFASVGSNPTADQLRAAGYTVTAVPATSSDGSADVFGNLSFGLYYVVESTPAEGYDPVLPFLVTVPQTDPADPEAWLYDVTVSPKNRAITTKQVADADVVHGDSTASATDGDVLTWTITGNIEDGDEDTYVITDTLDSRLRYIATRVSLLTGTTSTPLAAGDFEATTSGQTVTVSLTATGLAAINAADPATTEVVAEIDTAVRGGSTGRIVNSATIAQTGGLVTEIPSIESRWGAVRVTKQSPSAQPLAGATFEVWSSHTSDFATASDTGLSGTTDANGVTTIGSIRYSDYAGGDFVGGQNAAYNYYWLVETAAPAGFELLPEPVAFTLTADNSPDYLVGVTVENVPSNGGFALPLTGGSLPTVVFYAAGSALLIGAVLLLIRRQRAQTRG